MSAGPKRGMVLAAGLGTRMRAVSETIPKPLVPLAGKPLIAYALESLERAGVDEIVVNTHHLAAQIELFLADYARAAQARPAFSSRTKRSGWRPAAASARRSDGSATTPSMF